MVCSQCADLFSIDMVCLLGPADLISRSAYWTLPNPGMGKKLSSLQVILPMKRSLPPPIAGRTMMQIFLH
jgi:hypothetical protein